MRHADIKLTFEILNGHLECRSPAENIINNDLRVGLSIDRNASFERQRFPSGVEVVDEDNENNRAIDWAEGHHKICVFGAAWPGERQFGLRAFGNADLVVSRYCVHEPSPGGASKGVSYGLIAARDRHSDGLSDGVQGYVVDAKAPYEVINICDIFLMGFRGQEWFGEPRTIVHLLDVAKLHKFGDGLFDDGCFSRSEGGVFTSDGARIACVDFALIVFDGDSNA